MKTKTKRQERLDALLHFIIDYKTKYDGLAPSYREMQKGTNTSSKSVIRDRLGALEKAGIIKRKTGLPRYIVVVSAVGWRYKHEEPELQSNET